MLSECVTHAALGLIMPMHLLVDRSGHIIHAGPTADKLCGERKMIGQRLLEVLELQRPSRIDSVAKLRQLAGQRLHFRLRNRRDTVLKGIAVPVGEQGGLLINLSFGIGIIDAVHDFDLTSHDFAATDLAIEMLYLVEAKSAVLAELKRLNARLEGAKREAEEQAQTDMLTGLANRRAMDRRLAELAGGTDSFGLMHIDLDYFKDVNDTLGHAAGDFVLRNVASILRSLIRQGDVVARAGGDEFVILFPGLANVELLQGIAERIIARLEEPMVFEGQTCRISASIGTTVSEFYPNADPDRMLADADEALYASKRAGRARATLFGGEGANVREHLAQR